MKGYWITAAVFTSFLLGELPIIYHFNQSIELSRSLSIERLERLYEKTTNLIVDAKSMTLDYESLTTSNIPDSFLKHLINVYKISHIVSADSNGLINSVFPVNDVREKLVGRSILGVLNNLELNFEEIYAYGPFDLIEGDLGLVLFTRTNSGYYGGVVNLNHSLLKPLLSMDSGDTITHFVGINGREVVNVNQSCSNLVGMSSSLDTMVVTVKVCQQTDELYTKKNMFVLSYLLLSIFLSILIHKSIRENKENRTRAYKDSLTGAYNRNALNKYRKKHFEKDVRLNKTLYLFDLKKFKSFNSLYGHHKGDQVLILVTRFFEKIFPNDRIYRLGGDEFLIVSDERFYSPSTWSNLIKYNPKFFPSSVEFNIGYICLNNDAENNGENQDKFKSALTKADLALSLSKAKNYTYPQEYSYEVDENFRREREVVSAFSPEHMDNEFFFHYQPIYDLRTNSIVGVELLLRWESAMIGFVSPAEFIPIFEKNELMQVLGDWVLSSSLLLAERLHSKYNTLEVNINLSPNQISKSSLKLIADFLRKSAIEPIRVNFEITEHTMISDYKYVEKFISCLKKMGFGISLDDFGSGHASLSYLLNFTFDKIKLDKAYLSHIDSKPKLMNSIIKLCQSYGKDVVFEGIETENERLFLLSKGACYGQGYLMCRPVTYEEFKKMLS